MIDTSEQKSKILKISNILNISDLFYFVNIFYLVVIVYLVIIVVIFYLVVIFYIFYLVDIFFYERFYIYTIKVQAECPQSFANDKLRTSRNYHKLSNLYSLLTHTLSNPSLSYDYPSEDDSYISFTSTPCQHPTNWDAVDSS
jgi:hypothetical protein